MNKAGAKKLKIDLSPPVCLTEKEQKNDIASITRNGNGCETWTLKQ